MCYDYIIDQLFLKNSKKKVLKSYVVLYCVICCVFYICSFCNIFYGIM